MDKKWIIGIILGIVLLIVCCFISPKDKTILVDPNAIYDNAQKESSSIKEDEKRDFVEITVNEYLEKYQANEKSVILLSRTGCPYCQIVEPILQKIAKEYDLELYDLNTSTFIGEDAENFVNSNEVFQGDFGTPYFMIVGDNQLVDSIDGLTDYEHYVDFLSSNGII